MNNNSNLLLKSNQSNQQLQNDGEGSSKNLIFDALSSFSSQMTQENQMIQAQQQQPYQKFYIDPSIQAMFENQYKLDDSLATQENDISQVQLQQFYQQEIQDDNNSIQQNMMDGTNMMPNIDPSMITPEYLQMFTQFYQMFIQLQSLQGDSNNDNEFMNNEGFMQNLMVAFFQQMGHNQGQLMYDEGQRSPKNIRDYNSNLPLAAIPETKESMLEENSGWNTVKTNKLGQLMSASSVIAQDHGCSCCYQCQDSKKRNSYQPCSNFNAANLIPSIIGMQGNQDNYQRSETPSLATSLIIKNPFGSNLCTPTPNSNLNNQIKNISTLTSLDINQNLNQVFQQQNLNQLSQSPNYLQQNNFDSKRSSFINENCLSEKDFVDNFIQQNPIPEMKDSKNLMSPSNQPSYRISQMNDVILSPLQIQQTKLIEYMLDNDDMSNYKQRRDIIKGERLCRTLSRSGAKGSGFQHRPQQSVPNISQYCSQQQLQNYTNYVFQENINYQNIQQPQYEQFQKQFLDSYNKESRHFFSPQVQNKQQFFTKKSSFTEMCQQQEELYSPETYIDNEPTIEVKTKKIQRTQDKIKEIRIINQKREQIQLKKSQTRGNLKLQNSQKIFEIKDLKKSKSKANHQRKQSYNVYQANKENQKLLQSNIQQNYEMSHQNIIISPNKDLLMTSQDIQQYYSRKDSNTFKSLKGIWTQNNPSYNTSEDYNEIVSGLSSPIIANLKLNSLNKQNAIISPFDNMSMNNHQLRIKPEEIYMNNVLDDFEILLSERKPGQQIHIIKKPIQTEETKKIQERLNLYYQNKKKDEDKDKQRQMSRQNSCNQQQWQHNNENENALSMTKTLSSFKSLMMKTMSQMSIQQDQNLQQQYNQGKDQRTKLTKGNVGNKTNPNQSVNVSSIQDDLSYEGEYSENLSKMISPKNLYNGSLANIKHRNYQASTESEKSPLQKLVSPRDIQRQKIHSKKQSNSCLPNALFFKQQNNLHINEDTLSLKLNSRQPSLCYCGKSKCICDQHSQKDLLDHFQNFLHEMDKNPIQNQNIKQMSRESLMPSPIDNFCGNTNTSQDFLMSNFQLNGMGRSSSQSSRFNNRSKSGSNRQSMINTHSSSTNNNLTNNNGPRIKRFSSGAQIPTIMNLQETVQHSQSTQQLENSNKNHLIQFNLEINHDLKQIDTLTTTLTKSSDLEKLDTNKEEEIRLLTQENLQMQKAFIQKTHTLNLQEQQRQELMQRIQRHKVEQQKKSSNVTNKKFSLGSNGNGQSGCIGTTTQSTTQSMASGNSISYSKNPIVIIKPGSINISGTSLEERRKIQKYQKKVNVIKFEQVQRQNDIDNQFN